MKFIFKAIAKNPPSICIITGLALIVLSIVGLGKVLLALGILLIFAGIGLQVLYLYLKYKR